METLLDILAYVGIALLAWILVMLVWVALRFAFSRKPFYKEWRKEVDEENERKSKECQARKRPSVFSRSALEEEAWQRWPGMSGTAQQKRQEWMEKNEHRFYGC